MSMCVWGSLWGFHCSLSECVIFHSCMAHFGLTLKWVFLGMNTLCFTTGPWFLHSCINMCKQAESSSSHNLAFHVDSLRCIELHDNWIAYGEFLWPQHRFLSKRSQKEEFAFKVQYISFSIKTKWHTQNLTIGQNSRSNLQVTMIWMIENSSTQMKDVVSTSFHVAFLSPSLSRSLCLTPMVGYKMWPVDVHLGTKKIHFSYASNFIWMTILPGQGLALSLPPFLSHTSSFLSSNLSFLL